MHITAKNVGHLLKGASLLASGGGLAYEAQLDDIQKVLPALPISLAKLSDLGDDDPLITICEIGPSDAPPLPKHGLLDLLKLLVYEYKLAPPKAVLPFEIGQESITLEAAAVLNLPVVDTDMAGQRAVPTVGLDLISLCGTPTSSPVLAVNSRGSLLSIAAPTSPQATERQLRTFAAQSKGVVLVMSDHQQVGAVRPLLTHASYSYAIACGQSQAAFAKRIKVQREVTVTSITPHPAAGFYSAAVTLRTPQGTTWNLTVMNEYIGLKGQTGEAYAFPDVITLVDPLDGHGVASANLEVGQSYQLLVLRPIDRWQSIAAHTPGKMNLTSVGAT